MRSLLIIVFLFCLAGSAGAQATWNVPGQFPTIQDAISNGLVLTGDTVLVAPGTYMENIDFLGKAITVKSQAGPADTVIDGGSAGSVVTFAAGEGPGSVLEGFTITNGSGTPFPVSPSVFRCGGGILCDTTTPTIVGNVIENNDVGVDGYGGGVFCYSPGPTPEAGALIERNSIVSNMARVGGGIFTKYTEATILSNLIEGNSTTYGGGGIASWQAGSPLVINNMIVRNTGGTGGGIRCYGDTSLVIVNNNFIDNYAGTSGGAIYSKESDTEVRNSIFRGNSSPQGPEISVVLNAFVSRLSIDYSNLQGGLSSVYVEPGADLIWGAQMIDLDPLWLNESNADYRLTWDSPCRDAGDNLAPNLPAEDFEGDPRIDNGPVATVDMGADEFGYRLEYWNTASPGSQVRFVFFGPPNSTIWLFLDFTVLDPPWTIQPYGVLYIRHPFYKLWTSLPRIPGNGVLNIPVNLPGSLVPGQVLYFQALIGTYGHPDARLSNLMVLRIE